MIQCRKIQVREVPGKLTNMEVPRWDTKWRSKVTGTSLALDLKIILGFLLYGAL